MRWLREGLFETRLCPEVGEPAARALRQLWQWRGDGRITCGFSGVVARRSARMARHVIEVTHNHSEGLKGAAAIARAIFLARHGTNVGKIRSAIASAYGYDLPMTVDHIRPGYRFNETCQETVPQALVCALEATGFEDAIRNAISIGGDSDTVAAIAGPVAEARFGIPEDIATAALLRLPPEMRSVFGETLREGWRYFAG